MDKRIKICKEEAENQIQAFKDTWGFEDPKEITSGESSIPPEIRSLMLSGVMTGNIEFAEGYKKVVINLRERIKDGDKEIDQITVCPRRLKQHEIRQIEMTKLAEAKERKTEFNEASLLEGMGQTLAGISNYVYSMLCTKDIQALSCVTAHLVFI